MTMRQEIVVLTSRIQSLQKMLGEKELIHHSLLMTIVQITQRMGALQAKIDALMLEYCPDEMTEEQKDNWAKHQVQASKERDTALAEYDKAKKP